MLHCLFVVGRIVAVDSSAGTEFGGMCEGIEIVHEIPLSVASLEDVNKLVHTQAGREMTV